jgi:hypothetical protein
LNCLGSEALAARERPKRKELHGGYGILLPIVHFDLPPISQPLRIESSRRPESPRMHLGIASCILFGYD